MQIQSSSEFIKKLSMTSGAVSISHGVVFFDNGETFNLMDAAIDPVVEEIAKSVKSSLFPEGKIRGINETALSDLLFSNREQLLLKYKPIVSFNMMIGSGDFEGNAEQAESVRLALASFGHLLKTVQKTRYTFGDLAKKIEETYDSSNEKTVKIINDLRDLDLIN